MFLGLVRYWSHTKKWRVTIISHVSKPIPLLSDTTTQVVGRKKNNNTTNVVVYLQDEESC